MATVYLAGPIAHRTRRQMTEWRVHAAKELRPLTAVSPLRGMPARRSGRATNRPKDDVRQTDKAITRVGFDAAKRSDAILANFLGTQHVSIGTVMELSVAHDYDSNKLIVVVMDQRRLHDHPCVRDCASHIVDTLEEAISILRDALAA